MMSLHNTRLVDYVFIQQQSTFKGKAATSPIAKIPGVLVLNKPSTCGYELLSALL